MLAIAILIIKLLPSSLLERGHSSDALIREGTAVG